MGGAPAIVPVGDSLAGDLSEPGVGRRDNAGVEVTGGGVLPGLGSMVDTRSPVLLPIGTVVPEEISGKEWDKGED